MFFLLIQLFIKIILNSKVGQLGLLKFGEKVDQLHEMQTHFNSDDGAKIISQIDFKDERTKIAEVFQRISFIFNIS